MSSKHLDMYSHDEICYELLKMYKHTTNMKEMERYCDDLIMYSSCKNPFEEGQVSYRELFSIHLCKYLTKYPDNIQDIMADIGVDCKC